MADQSKDISGVTRSNSVAIDADPLLPAFSGQDLVNIAQGRLGQAYELGVYLGPDGYNNANYSGAFDCSEFVSWSVYQASGQQLLLGVGQSTAFQYNAYTGRWYDELGTNIVEISWDKAINSTGALLLDPPDNYNDGGGDINLGGETTNETTARNHIMISEGNGQLIHATSSSGVSETDFYRVESFYRENYTPVAMMLDNVGSTTADHGVLQLDAPIAGIIDVVGRNGEVTADGMMVDSDLYQLQTVAGGIYTINATAVSMSNDSVALAVLDSSGQEINLFGENQREGTNPTITFTATDNTYFIRVTGGGQDWQYATGHYNLTAVAGTQSNIANILYGDYGNSVAYGGESNDLIYGNINSNFAAFSAISLNQQATNEYLLLENYAGITGPANNLQFTVEMIVSGLRSRFQELISYANSQSNNALVIEGRNNGNIHVSFRGVAHDTTISTSLLTDGQDHRFSMSWDGTGAAGQYIIYIDGAEVGRGQHPRQTDSLNPGGTLIFGQEQDSLGGGFETYQILNGAIADIRIFNDVRSAQEIADNAFAPLTNPATEQGLVNNWQVDTNAIANGTVVDAAGGNALSIAGQSAPAQVALNGVIAGIALNQQADNQHLNIANYNGFSNGAFTLEFLAILPANADADTVLLTYSPGWALELEFLDGIMTLTLPSGRYDSAIALASLNDGLPHRISISWDSTTGELNFYIDGALTETAIHAQGAIIDSGGRLVFAQQLTNSGSEFAGDGYAATLGDIRIFSDVRTAQEIANNAFTPLGAPLNEQGLVNNWQADATSIANGVVADAAGGLGLTIAGTSAPVLSQIGTFGDNSLFGGIGNDTLDGGIGDDSLDGGDGADRVLGGEGNDTIAGQAGSDNLQGGNGNDILLGGADLDRLYGQSGNDTLSGDAGNDIIFGGIGLDTITGGAGHDLINGNAGTDLITGDDGNDTIFGGSDIDQINGGLGNDIIYGQSENDVIFGADGRDNINGGGGDDLLQGESGDDRLTGSVGNDTLLGGDGADTLHGGLGADDLSGNSQNDVLYGYWGDDTLLGGDGQDALFGGLGNDQLTGQAGSDRFVFYENWGNDVIIDFANDGLEKIDLRTIAGIDALSDLTITDGAGGAQVAFADNIITVSFITAAQLDETDFLL